MKIKNISEAKSAIGEMRNKFAEGARIGGEVYEFLSNLEDIFIGAATKSGVSQVRSENGNGITPANPKPEPAPDSLTDRVLKIIKDAGVPLRIREAVAEYESRQWPDPGKGTIYNAVAGTIAYLYHKKRVITKNKDGGYYLRPNASANRADSASTEPALI